MTQSSLNYAALLDSVACAISDSVAVVQVACTNQSAGSEPIEIMRESYNNSVKPQLVAGSFGVESLTSEVGGAYGELCTHLLSLIARWRSYRAANNKRIRLVDVQDQIASEAAAFGRSCLESVSTAVSSAMQAEAMLKSKANLFVKLVFAHVQTTDKTYKPSYSSFSPLGICLDSLTSKNAVYSFGYWDGADLMGAPLGWLYSTEQDRQILEKLAATAFGQPVRFTEDYNSIVL